MSLESWREEKQSSFLYGALAEAEGENNRGRLFRDLARAAEKQAAMWAAKARAAGEAVPDSFKPGLRARIVAKLACRFGGRAMKPALAALKVRGLSMYSLPSLSSGHGMPTAAGSPERVHRGASSGGSLRAAVFGLNDGLVSNTSLILGVAGASPDSHLILISGLAGLLAGSFSMASGEYVSVRSQRELFEYQIGLEKAELDEYPEEEEEEVALIYKARGLPIDEARALAKRVMSDPRQALDTLAREELGLNPDDLGSPWNAAISSFAAFASGAALPLLPFFVTSGSRAVSSAAIVSGVALLGVGCALSLFTGKSAWWSGLRMLLIGSAAAGATWLVGHLFGVSVN